MNRWRVVLGGVLMNLALGSLYAWSVFVAPLEKEFGWKRADTSLVYTVAVVTFALSFILAGRIQDKKGPKVCAFIGTLCVSAGFFLASLTNSLLFLYTAFGVIVGIGNGFGYATPIPVASKWFPDKRGLVVGIMVGAYGAASFLIGLFVPKAPMAWYQVWSMIDALGWRMTFRVLAVCFLGMGLVATYLLENPPAGYRPEGWTPPVAAAARRDFTTGEMLRTPQFYLLWLAYCLGTTAGQMTISQLAPFATSVHITVATAVLISACGNAGGRILSGWLSETLGRVNTLRVMVLASALAMPAWYTFRDTPAMFFLLVAAVYWCYGTQLSVFATTTADMYGTKNLGLNYGALFTAWGVAGILGPTIAGRVFDATKNYQYAFYAASALALVAFASLLLAKSSIQAPEPLVSMGTAQLKRA